MLASVPGSAALLTEVYINIPSRLLLRCRSVCVWLMGNLLWVNLLFVPHNRTFYVGAQRGILHSFDGIHQHSLAAFVFIFFNVTDAEILSQL